MALITPNEGPNGLTTSIDSLERQLADMRRELEAMYARIKDGEFGELKNASKATTEIRQWLKIAIEAEAQLASRQKRDLGISNSYGLDLDQALEEIDGRMAAHARARDTKEVP